MSSMSAACTVCRNKTGAGKPRESIPHINRSDSCKIKTVFAEYLSGTPLFEIFREVVQTKPNARGESCCCYCGEGCDDGGGGGLL